MSKPNIIDEIIQCLKSQRDFDTTMDKDVLLEFINDPVSKCNSKSGAQVSVFDMPEWDALRDKCSKCMLCSLGQARTCRTFAEGYPHAELMFIWDVPQTDSGNIPLPGSPDELLSRMIAAMMFDRANETCIVSVVKCCPAENRNPSSDEMVSCVPYLKQQIAIVKPKTIVLLGVIPLLALFNLKDIAAHHGQWLDYDGIPVMPIYHPAFLLRNKMAKKDAWIDLQAVMTVFGRRPKSRK